MRAVLALLVLPLVLGLLGMHALAAHAVEPAAAPGQAAADHFAAGHSSSSGMDDDACHPGCPPSGAAHSSDCIPAPGAQAPTVPAAVVLLRSDAVLTGPAGSVAPRPDRLGASPAPELHDLSISRT
ncbi:DUF6153 family protein [Sinomonas terrae]|uniref:DUF6153 family protein n=1 Tax=Sinomonas terrae TaxID=2908838 RepID=A0ABS9TWG3_9MICC|nr:DUF6153 family protein [Sinomonas terrae]MCH6468769.1 DUF6153 family protein [Sinomonas terrae]